MYQMSTVTSSSVTTACPTATRVPTVSARVAHAPAHGRSAAVAPTFRALRSSGTFTAAPVRMPCARSRATPARAQRMMVLASKNVRCPSTHDVQQDRASAHHSPTPLDSFHLRGCVAHRAIHTAL